MHTSYLSQTPQTCLCKKKLPGVIFYRFNAKNWHFRQILREKVAFFTDLTRKIGVFFTDLTQKIGVFFTDFTQKIGVFFTDLTRKIGVFRCKFYSPKN